MSAADSRPLVSVVVTCCNQAHTLAATVASVAARTARLQIVVVDDGSSDGTAGVARRLDVVFLRQPARGLAAAKNHGLGVSTGEFVIFLGAADRLMAGAIDVGVRALTAHPGCAMAYGRATLAGASRAALTARELPIVRAGHHAALLQTNLIWTPGMAIFRRDAVRRAGGFAEDLDGAADYDLCLRISREAPVVDHGCSVAITANRRGTPSHDAARLLHDTLEVMRRNCPDPHTPLHAAWREGYARWQEIYGAELADEIRRDLHRRAIAEATRKGVAFVSLAPRVFVRELGRTARLGHARQRRTNNTTGAPLPSKVPNAAMPTPVSRP